MFLIEVQMVVTLYVFTQDNCCLADPHLINLIILVACKVFNLLDLIENAVAFKEV